MESKKVMRKRETIKYPDMREWRKNRYRVFNEKIDSFKDHPNYGWLRKYANDAMTANEGVGYSMIVGADFIKKIEDISMEDMKTWLDGVHPH